MRTLFVTALAFALTGCSLFGDDERTVVMPVEEVRVAEVARVGEPLDATFVGVLTNGCQQFERLEVSASARRARVTMLARVGAEGVCTTDVRGVERAYQLLPQAPGPLVIEVQQPDGSVTEHEVRVE